MKTIKLKDGKIENFPMNECMKDCSHCGHPARLSFSCALGCDAWYCPHCNRYTLLNDWEKTFFEHAYRRAYRYVQSLMDGTMGLKWATEQDVLHEEAQIKELEKALDRSPDPIRP